ncbi:hypothetical protein FB451DRAFT_1234978 [Mycena latifolia]|nr:hypothetical protein FB451DRAFT_1234978 [Mycena latifolia]
MQTSSLPVQELWDHIIDYVNQSLEDLKSCSLVCQSFVPRAQSHIFRAIVISAKQDAANRLAMILSSSTHLIHYTRILYFGSCAPEIISPLTRIPWSRVHTISFSRYREASQLPDHTLEEICHLVGIPSLRSLDFHRGLWETDQLLRVFAHCTIGLDRVTFFACGLRIASNSGVAVSPAQRRKIRFLSLKYSPRIPDILVHPACPLDFSVLTALHCVGAMRPATNTLFLQARLTISSLHISGLDETIASLDLALFPALKSIKCDHVGPTLTRILQSLPPTNVVDTIRLAVFGQPVGVLDLREFEAAIFAVKIPELRHVEIELVTPPSLVHTSTTVAEALKADLPLLHEKGLLSVHFT